MASIFTSIFHNPKLPRTLMSFLLCSACEQPTSSTFLEFPWPHSNLFILVQIGGASLGEKVCHRLRSFNHIDKQFFIHSINSNLTSELTYVWIQHNSILCWWWEQWVITVAPQGMYTLSEYRIDYTQEWVMRLCNPRVCGYPEAKPRDKCKQVGYRT